MPHWHASFKGSKMLKPVELPDVRLRCLWVFSVAIPLGSFAVHWPFPSSSSREILSFGDNPGKSKRHCCAQGFVLEYRIASFKRHPPAVQNGKLDLSSTPLLKGKCIRRQEEASASDPWEDTNSPIVCGLLITRKRAEWGGPWWT